MSLLSQAALLPTHPHQALSLSLHYAHSFLLILHVALQHLHPLSVLLQFCSASLQLILKGLQTFHTYLGFARVSMESSNTHKPLSVADEGPPSPSSWPGSPPAPPTVSSPPPSGPPPWTLTSLTPPCTSAATREALPLLQ